MVLDMNTLVIQFVFGNVYLRGPCGLARIGVINNVGCTFAEEEFCIM